MPTPEVIEAAREWLDLPSTPAGYAAVAALVSTLRRDPINPEARAHILALLDAAPDPAGETVRVAVGVASSGTIYTCGVDNEDDEASATRKVRRCANGDGIVFLSDIPIPPRPEVPVVRGKVVG